MLFALVSEYTKSPPSHAPTMLHFSWGFTGSSAKFTGNAREMMRTDEMNMSLSLNESNYLQENIDTCVVDTPIRN